MYACMHVCMYGYACKLNYLQHFCDQALEKVKKSECKIFPPSSGSEKVETAGETVIVRVPVVVLVQLNPSTLQADQIYHI